MATSAASSVALRDCAFFRINGPLLLAFLALLLPGTIGCGEDAAGPRSLPGWARLKAAGRGPDRLALVVASDWVSGGISVIDVQTRAVQPLVALVHGDAVARYHDGRLYVINRQGQDNLQVLDGGYSTVVQLSLGNGSNPQDLAFLPGGDEALVSRYAADPLILSLSGGAPPRTLSLADWHDEDGSAETSYVAESGGHVLIAAQRLENYAPRGRSVILDYDPASGLVAGRPTQADNPYSPLVADPCRPGGWLVGMVGRFGVLDSGGIERLDESGASAGLLIDEAALGGDVVSFVMTADGSAGFVLVAAAGADPGHQETRLVRFPGCAAGAGGEDGDAGAVQILLAPGGWVLGGLALDDRGELWVADRSPTSPGVRIFDAASGTELTARPIDTGLPPFQILFAP